MIDRATREKIADLARSATIGCGNIDLDEPDLAAIAALRYALGRKPTGEELGLYCSEWNSCIMQAAQP